MMRVNNSAYLFINLENLSEASGGSAVSKDKHKSGYVDFTTGLHSSIVIILLGFPSYRLTIGTMYYVLCSCTLVSSPGHPHIFSVGSGLGTRIEYHTSTVIVFYLVVGTDSGMTINDMTSPLFPPRLNYKKQVQNFENFENNNVNPARATTYGATATTAASTGIQVPGTGTGGRRTIISDHYNVDRPLVFSGPRPPMQQQHQNQNQLPGNQVTKDSVTTLV